MRRTIVLFCMAKLGFAALPLFGDNWPQWRGPHWNNVSAEKGLPTHWDREQNMLWRLELPGAAGASPIVWDDRVFVTSADEQGKLLLICVGTDGQHRWTRELSDGNRNIRNDEGNLASPSPSTDGQHVWAMMADGVLGCFTVDGEPVWRVDLQQRYGQFDIAYGMSSTPVLDSGRLYLQLIQGPMRDPRTSQGLVVALDGKTGYEVWKTVRRTDARVECKHSYASPFVYRADGLEFLVTHGADFVIAHSLADGTELWRCGDLNAFESYHPTLRFVASPTWAPGLIVAPSAKNGPVLALKPDGSGDITQDTSHYHWRMDRKTPDVPTPVIHDGLVYLCRENGVLLCVDAVNGELIYEQRTVDDRHRASPVLADDKLYLTARSGTVTVVRPGREFKILAQNEMGEGIAASPAVANGRIYIRTYNALYAIGHQ